MCAYVCTCNLIQLMSTKCNVNSRYGLPRVNPFDIGVLINEEKKNVTFVNDKVQEYMY